MGPKNGEEIMKRSVAITMLILAVLLFLSSSIRPVHADIFGQLGRLYGCVVTWGVEDGIPP